MRKAITFLLLFSALLLGRQDANAGAWTQKRGEGYYKLGLRVIRATRFYEPGGNRISIPTTSDYTTSFYGEYGLTDRVTLVADVPFKRITLNKQVERGSGFVLFGGDEKTGIADSELGVRFGLIRSGPSVLSAEFLFGLPIGDDTQQSGLMTGDGEFNQQLKLQFGQSLYPRPFYFSAEVGFNNRTNGFSDEFRYAAEIGYTFKTKFLAIFKARGVESLKNGADGISGGMVGLFANNQSYLAFGPELVYSIDRTLGIVVGVEGATRAENVLSAVAFSVGFFVKR